MSGVSTPTTSPGPPPAEGAGMLGFRRVIVASVRDSCFAPRACYAADGAGDPEAIVRAGHEPLRRLDQRLRETQVVRRRRPIVVTHAQHDALVHKGLLRATGWRSYVAAPVVVRAGVIGFLHADHSDHDRLVISAGTAKVHVKNILRKLEVSNRAEATSRFFRGAVSQDDLPA